MRAGSHKRSERGKGHEEVSYVTPPPIINIRNVWSRETSDDVFFIVMFIIQFVMNISKKILLMNGPKYPVVFPGTAGFMTYLQSK